MPKLIFERVYSSTMGQMSYLSLQETVDKQLEREAEIFTRNYGIPLEHPHKTTVAKGALIDVLDQTLTRQHIYEL